MAEIVLIGFMGAGKTTVGRLLAEKLELELTDIDHKLEQTYQLSVAEFFNQYGEAAFRVAEQEVLKQALADSGIIATGGGIVVEAANRQLLQKQGCVIYLKNSSQAAYDRVTKDHMNLRPLAVNGDKGSFYQLHASRQKLYQEASQLTIDTDDLTPSQVVSRIISELKGKAGDR